MTTFALTISVPSTDTFYTINTTNAWHCWTFLHQFVPPFESEPRVVNLFITDVDQWVDQHITTASECDSVLRSYFITYTPPPQTP